MRFPAARLSCYHAQKAVSREPLQKARSVDEAALDPSEEARIRAQIAALREDHQDLDDAVSALEALPMPDQLQIARLKKKKLTLRDQIAKLEDKLTPDIIA